MTKTQAIKILGVSSGCSFETARKAYQKKASNLQLKLRPGMPVQARRQAHKQLAELTDAWKTIKASCRNKAAKTAANKASPKKSPRPAKPATKKARQNSQPQHAKAGSLAHAWQRFADALGIPEPVFIAAFVITAILLLLIGFLK